jgi:hypothetical protein
VNGVELRYNERKSFWQYGIEIGINPAADFVEKKATLNLTEQFSQEKLYLHISSSFPGISSLH